MKADALAERVERLERQNSWLKMGGELCSRGYLAVSRSTLYRWRRDGRLPYYKAGKITRYKQEDLDAVLERQEPGTED